jgi:hypothetical protein
LTGYEIRNQRDETADKVADGESDGGHVRLIAIRFRLLVVKVDEEITELVGGVVQRRVDFGDSVVGDPVCDEGLANEGVGFCGVFEDGVYLANGGLV